MNRIIRAVPLYAALAAGGVLTACQGTEQQTYPPAAAEAPAAVPENPLAGTEWIPG